MSLTETMHKINDALNRQPVATVAAPRDKATVFISFRNSDRESATKCAEHLEAAGFSAWWSGLLTAGEDFGETIATKLECADAVVVLWSDNSVKSPWVKAEAGTAFELDKLVPVRLAGLDPKAVPHPFGTLHMVDFGDTAGLVRAIERIVRRVGPSRAAAAE